MQCTCEADKTKQTQQKHRGIRRHRMHATSYFIDATDTERAFANIFRSNQASKEHAPDRRYAGA